MANYDDTAFDTDAAPPPPLPAQKPTAATIFAILNLLFGAGGYLVLLIGLASVFLLEAVIPPEEMPPQPPLAVNIVNWSVYVILGTWLIVSGIQLLKVSIGSREWFIRYCIVSLVVRPIVILGTIPFTLDAAREQMRMQAEQMPDNPFANQFGDSFVTAMILFGSIFGIIWAVAYEVAGLIVMKNQKTIAAFEAYQRYKYR